MSNVLAEQNLRWDLNSPWAMGLDDYCILKQHLCQQEPQIIVELGSGSSTFQFAHDFPDASVVSLESGEKFLEQNNGKLKALSMNNARVVHAPIRTRVKFGGIYTTYDFDVLADDMAIDGLLVDGPVEALYPLGREASLYFLFDRLKVGAVIGLDDYHRVSAKAAVKNWLAIYGDSLSLIEETPSFAVLRKTAECHRPEYMLVLALQSYATLAGAVTKKLCGTVLRR